MFSGGDDKSRLRFKDGKKALGLEDARKRRENKNVSLRTTRRDELLFNKRRVVPAGDVPHVMMAANAIDGNSVEAVPRHLTQAEAEEPIPPLSVIAELIVSENPSDQFRATVGARRLLSVEQSSPLQDVIDIGDQIIIKRLVAFLKRDEHPKLQFEAAWALTNVACGDTNQARLLIEHHAIEEFLRLLGSPDHEVAEQAVWGIGNVAGDNEKFRDHILAMNALEPILNIARSNPPLSLLRLVAWAISNLCRGRPKPPFEVIRPAMEVLAVLLRHPDEEVAGDSTWAFSYLTDVQQECVDHALELNITPRLVELLGQPMDATGSRSKIRTAALRTLGNFVTGEDAQTQIVIQNGALIPIRNILAYADPALRKEACWTISNITAGPSHQIQAVIDAGIFPVLLRNLRLGEFEVRKEAAWAIANATYAREPDHIQYLVSEDAIPILSDLLSMDDVVAVQVALEGLQNILNCGEGLEEVNPYATSFFEHNGLARLERLERHKDATLRSTAIAILTTFFETQEEDDAAAVDCVMGEGGMGVDPGAAAAHGPISFD